ncbi:MAG: rRNA maturation RNase YbeY [Verrucomicrobia bacterium]|nr:rRNA maturation RNase YbeY [Verrucomicrobiota bacterium]
MKAASRPPAAGRPVLIANRHPRLRLDRRRVAQLVRLLDTEFRVRPAERRALVLPPAGPGLHDPQAELSLVFLTDRDLARLHAEFLADPTVTDVITFEGNPALGTAGEICVSADAARRQVRGGNTAGRDFATELTLYVVHGWLHLTGYDDLRPARKRVMRRAEARALRLLAGRLGSRPLFRLRH